MATPAWTVRPGRPDDIAPILELFQATFGKPMPEAVYRWKFLESPWSGTAPTTFVAAAGERIVGHYSATPLRLRLGHRDLAVVHGSDSMVASDFRGRGVMTAICREAHQAWAAGGTSLLLTLPTQNWVKLNDRVGYRATFDLGWLWRPLRPSALLPRRMRRVGSREDGAAREWNRLGRGGLERAGGGGGVEVSPVDSPGPEFDSLWEAVKGRYEALVVRDREWLRYRFVTAPAFDYRILLARVGSRPVGYLVYRLMPGDEGPGAWIADLFTAPDDRAARAALLRAAFGELRRSGAADVRIYAADPPLARELKRAGFLQRKGAYDLRVGPFTDELPWDLLRDPRRFFVMGGDFDVV